MSEWCSHRQVFCRRRGWREWALRWGPRKRSPLKDNPSRTRNSWKGWSEMGIDEVWLVWEDVDEVWVVWIGVDRLELYK